MLQLHFMASRQYSSNLSCIMNDVNALNGAERLGRCADTGQLQPPWRLPDQIRFDPGPIGSYLGSGPCLHNHPPQARVHAFAENTTRATGEDLGSSRHFPSRYCMRALILPV